MEPTRRDGGRMLSEVKSLILGVFDIASQNNNGEDALDISLLSTDASVVDALLMKAMPTLDGITSDVRDTQKTWSTYYRRMKANGLLRPDRRRKNGDGSGLTPAQRERLQTLNTQRRQRTAERRRREETAPTNNDHIRNTRRRADHGETGAIGGRQPTLRQRETQAAEEEARRNGFSTTQEAFLAATEGAYQRHYTQQERQQHQEQTAQAEARAQRTAFVQQHGNIYYTQPHHGFYDGNGITQQQIHQLQAQRFNQQQQGNTTMYATLGAARDETHDERLQTRRIN